MWPARQTLETRQTRQTRALWLLLLIAAAVGIGVIAFPTFYVMPFKTQDARTFEWARRARTLAPVVTLVASVIAWALAIAIAWRTGRWGLKPLPILVAGLVALGAWFARQNHFEWMFAPQEVIAHVAADKATFVADDDLVMAVALRDETVAYPIRQIAYHHVVNDIVGGEPIAATY
jgi:hypothetical protein